ncbi:MAG: DUF1501 domain-containing protein [Planctomycetales bacterium]|nr:DUF1501 domain-containing protein [Planctomycetales bacterium]
MNAASRRHGPSHRLGLDLASLTSACPTSALRVGSRRWFLQAGMAGLGAVAAGAGGFGSTLSQAAEAVAARPQGDRKAVILFWLSGGPSHIDMWDPKPDAPSEIRGPFATIPTKLPGVNFSEHLPLHAALADKLSIIRSVDCSASNHTPITMQAGNPLARRTDNNKDGDGYPSMGSVVAKFRGPNHPDLPAFVGLAPSWKADVYEAGHLGPTYAPVNGIELAGKFKLPEGVQLDRLQDRDGLRREFDRLRRDLDLTETLERSHRYQRQAFDLVVSGQVETAFNLNEEPDSVREAYGRESIGEKGLLARRLVESGVTFVLVSGRWGYFDHHGDNVPPWGGIEKGLKPILPTVDRVLHALITDLAQRGLLDSTLVLMLGEFGRSPVMTADAGRNHWTNVMSMLAAGGGLKHGQVIGSTDSRGHGVKDGLVRPQDLAATVFRHLGIDLTTHWINPQGRPTPIVTEGGRPIPELFA